MIRSFERVQSRQRRTFLASQRSVLPIDQIIIVIVFSQCSFAFAPVGSAPSDAIRWDGVMVREGRDGEDRENSEEYKADTDISCDVLRDPLLIVSQVRETTASWMSRLNPDGHCLLPDHRTTSLSLPDPHSHHPSLTRHIC